MREEIKKGFKLARYGDGRTVSVIMAVVFLVLGTLIELFPVEAMRMMPVDAGCILLLCVEMFLPQLTLSVAIAQMAQVSPCKRAIQTRYVAEMHVVGMLVMDVWIVLMRLVSAVWRKDWSMLSGESLLFIGIWTFILLCFNGICYKVFFLSMILLYVLMFSMGFLVAVGKIVFPPVSIHPLVAILTVVVLAVLGGCIQYGIARLLYKFPLSKAVFAMSAPKEM